ncbi:MAG: hypothetical protein RLY70_3920 [Planctomycetota bacterium]
MALPCTTDILSVDRFVRRSWAVGRRQSSSRDSGRKSVRRHAAGRSRRVRHARDGQDVRRTKQDAAYKWADRSRSSLCTTDILSVDRFVRRSLTVEHRQSSSLGSGRKSIRRHTAGRDEFDMLATDKMSVVQSRMPLTNGPIEAALPFVRRTSCPSTERSVPGTDWPARQGLAGRPGRRLRLGGKRGGLGKQGCWWNDQCLALIGVRQARDGQDVRRTWGERMSA